MKAKRERSKKAIRLTQEANRTVLLRILVAMVALGVVIFIPLGVRLYQIMIRDHDKYSGMAIDNQTRSTSVSASRGSIYDCNMNVLATSATVENVFLDPNEIETAGQDVGVIARGLSDILGVTEEFVRAQASDTKMRYKIITRKIEADKAAEVRQFIVDNSVTGIHLEPDTQRYYPNGALMAQALGFVRTDNVGAEGIEAYYDSYLEGTTGKIITAKGNYGSEMLYTYEKYYEATDGYSLVTTMDSTVQYYLQKHIEAAIEQYDVLNGAFGIVMDVNTGAVLAMANYDNYDPNNFLEIYEESTSEELQRQYDEMEELDHSSEEYAAAKDAYNDAVVAARLAQWRNRCISDGYEPGSTFKTVTLAAALEEGAVTLNDTFYCGGTVEIWGRLDPLECWNHNGHGQETTAQALQNSCNIAFAEIAILLGGEKFYNYMSRFGFLDKTGIDLPGEGYSVTHDYSHFTDYESYGYSTLTSVAFGQTFKITPIQLVRAISAIVNGGNLMEPYVVAQILDENGNVVEETQPTCIRQVISSETSANMRNLMISVVEEGTGGNAKVVGYTIGGKTGTSEKIDEFTEWGTLVDDKIVSFVGVAFDEDGAARYICLIALDTPSTATGQYISGGVMAAPTVGDVFTDILPYLGITASYAETEISQVNFTMPACKGLDLDAAADVLADKHLTYRVVGDGETVTGQIPAAGNPIPGNSEVILYMGADVPTGTVTVPDFRGLTIEQAYARASYVGLYIQARGSTGSGRSVTATSQDVEVGTEVARGTTITVKFTDASALD